MISNVLIVGDLGGSDRSNQDYTNIYDPPFISTSTEYPPTRSFVHYSLSGITKEWVI